MNTRGANPKGVAIIGGGPAGCIAALRCSQLGIRTVIFEAGKKNRDKPCGDALLEGAINHARAFGLTDRDFRRLGGRPFAGIDVALSHRTAESARLSNSGGWVIPRSSFDQALRDAISSVCDVRYGTVVRSLFPTDSGVSVTISRPSHHTEHFSAAIIAAGGSSRLSKLLEIDGRPTKGLAIRGYITDPHASDALLFEISSPEFTQYKWYFPLANTANIGACYLDDYSGMVVDELRMLARSYGETRLAGGVEPLWSGSSAKWHHPGGILSCGDSAGLVDPVTGEGITAAFVSGEMAASAIADYLGSHGDVALVNFSGQIREVFTEKYNTDRRTNLLNQFSSLGKGDSAGH